ncbi:MAG: non-canonical purine NTP pyrophosphatase [Campylobacterota bacterium]|nr:non-canonical purine NTP pyrophosphatase [Campylobacterota bacterium]
MKIIIASGNKGKVKEFKSLLANDEVIPFKDIVGDIDIVEDGLTFQENAIIKVKAIYKKLKNTKDVIIISDDSGISVPILNNEPNIYSARYAGIGSTDAQNNEKLIFNLKAKNIKKTTAHYTACIAIMYNENIYTTHGWMYGDVIDKEIGDGGFGYDTLFIPNGYDETLGTLDNKIKKDLSHRSKALKLAMKLMKVILK